MNKKSSYAVEHGLTQPLSGGTDVMQKLQNQLLEDQGRPPRPENHRLANNLLPVEMAQGKTAGLAPYQEIGACIAMLDRIRQGMKDKTLGKGYSSMETTIVIRSIEATTYQLEGLLNNLLEKTPRTATIPDTTGHQASNEKLAAFQYTPDGTGRLMWAADEPVLPIEVPR